MLRDRFDVRTGENLHIVLWLVKDMCWAVDWGLLAATMVLPTVAVAVLIAWKHRHEAYEFMHALATVFWIGANSTWMVGEFFGWDEDLFGGFGLRQLSLIPFGIGFCILMAYYCGPFWRETNGRTGG